MALIKGKQIASGSISSDRLALSDDFAFSGAVTVSTPSGSTQVANKSYVDSVVTGGQAGLDFKESVRLASTQSIDNENATTAFSYSAGVLTETSAAAGTILIDSTPLALGNRILLKNESTASNNGLYEVTRVGDGSSTTWELTRASDSDTSSDLTAGAFMFIEAGTSNANKSFVLQTVQSGGNAGQSPTLDTDDLSFIQFSGAGQISVGTGLSKDVDTINLDHNALNAVAADAYDFANDSFILYDDSASESKKLGMQNFVNGLPNVGLDVDSSTGKLNVKFDSNGGLGGSANSGIKIHTGNIAESTALISTHTIMLGSTAFADVRDITLQNFLTEIAGNGLTVDTTDLELDASLPTSDSGSISASAGDNSDGIIDTDDFNTGLSITSTPAGDSDVRITVNGVGIKIGSGSKTGCDAFFDDGASGARTIASITAGDNLHWNGNIAGQGSYALESSDVVEIFYNA